MSNYAFNYHDPAVTELSRLDYCPPAEQRPKIGSEADSLEQISTNPLKPLPIDEGTKPLILKPGSRLPCGFGLLSNQATPIVLDEQDNARWRLCAKIVSSFRKHDKEAYPIRFWDHVEDKADREARSLLLSELGEGKPASRLLSDAYPGVDIAAAIDAVSDTISGGSEHYFHDIFNKATDNRHFPHAIQAIALFFLPIIYGGIHLAARNFAFSSRTEKTLWLISCIITMVMLPAGELLLLLYRCILHFGIAFVYFCCCCCCCVDSSGDFEGGYHLGVNIATMSFLTLYVGCRIFIVVEVFISLRNTPLGVFASTPWLQGLPHI